jgi:hypothetical protein
VIFGKPKQIFQLLASLFAQLLIFPIRLLAAGMAEKHLSTLKMRSVESRKSTQQHDSPWL